MLSAKACRDRFHEFENHSRTSSRQRPWESSTVNSEQRRCGNSYLAFVHFHMPRLSIEINNPNPHSEYVFTYLERTQTYIEESHD